MTFMRIRLEAARSREFPEGSTHHGYSFVLPLNGDGKLDRAAFAHDPQICTVRRFWGGEDDEVGHLIKNRGGRFAFSFREDEEPIHRLDEHVFRAGEYLSVKEPDGKIYAFKVTEVRPAPGLATKRGG